MNKKNETNSFLNSQVLVLVKVLFVILSEAF